MAEYLEPLKHPLSPAAAEQADRKGPLKRCGHAPDYRCACAAHEEPETHPDLVDELTMNPGYRLARAYSYELHGGDDVEDGRAPKHPTKVHHTHRWTTQIDGQGPPERGALPMMCEVCGEQR